VTLPNFVVIGVPKAGTSSLQQHISLHPQAFAAWEPRFLHFAGQAIAPGLEERRAFRIKSLAEYEAVFAMHAQCKALGDSSPSYMMYPDPSIEGIRQYVPDAKFIAIFRQPADRGYSEYVHQVMRGQEPCRQYADALRAEQAGRVRDEGQWRQYFQRGFYSVPTRKFLDAFPRERFLFLLFDDLVCDPAGLLRSIFQFLKIDPEFLPDLEKRYRVGRWPKHFRLHTFLNSRRSPARWVERILPHRTYMNILSRINGRNLGKPPTLDPQLRRELTNRYREDILKLQDLIGRDLSGWLAV
jgi:hypothetical protein